MNEDRMFTASEVLMLMLDCGTTASQLFAEVPQYRMQAEFILQSKETNESKRLAFHSILLNVASKIITDYCKQRDADEQKEQTDSKEQESADDGKTED